MEEKDIYSFLEETPRDPNCEDTELIELIALNDISRYTTSTMMKEISWGQLSVSEGQIIHLDSI